jgi:autophagy-related protein 13
MGTLSLRATYLAQPHFRVDDLESLLSSRFLSLDEGPEFTPTLIKNQQRDSLTTPPPGSLPLRAVPPRSPPSTIADRFVLPLTNNTRSNFPSTGGTGALSVGLGKGSLTRSPSSRPRIISSLDPGAASGISETPSSRRSISAAKEDPQLASRLWREGSGSSARRPNIFKSSSLSNTTSPLSPSQPLHHRRNSPLSDPSLPSRSLTPPLLPGIPNHRTGGRRYSSSFGYRYTANTGARSYGSASSSPERKVGPSSVSDRIACPPYHNIYTPPCRVPRT